MKSVAVLILTFNEAPNIARTLSKVSWADDIVVVDSDSTDGTPDIAAGHPKVRVFQHTYISQAEKWTFGLTQTGITADWVLALDADYVLSDAIVQEIAALPDDTTTSGYRASFIYCIDGHPLRGAAYPPVTVLYRRERASYMQDGHTQRVQIQGTISALAGPIYHDDRKSLTHWLGAQVRCARLEAVKLIRTPFSSLSSFDRVRRLIFMMPPLMFLYCLFARGGVLDGKRGLYYAMQRTLAELLLSLYLFADLLGLDSDLR